MERVRLPYRPPKIRNYEELGSDKLERIKTSKKEVGSRNDRKLKNYSDKFNTMFNFYLSIQRSGLITFCGVDVKVNFDVNGSDGKFGFREYDNGRYNGMIPISKHPNILRSVIIGKKGWGLWLNTWSEGIVEWSFTQDEILNEFKIRNIEIPKSLMNDFNNRIYQLKIKRNEKYKMEYTKSSG